MLKQWAILALQENRMLLQSSLLDEQQVFISTGLEGKDKNYVILLYLLIGIERNLSDTQRKLLKNELIFELKKNEGEFEMIDFMEGFSTALVMLPLQADLKKFFAMLLMNATNMVIFCRKI